VYGNFFTNNKFILKHTRNFEISTLKIIKCYENNLTKNAILYTVQLKAQQAMINVLLVLYTSRPQNKICSLKMMLMTEKDVFISRPKDERDGAALLFQLWFFSFSLL